MSMVMGLIHQRLSIFLLFQMPTFESDFMNGLERNKLNWEVAMFIFSLSLRLALLWSCPYPHEDVPS